MNKPAKQTELIVKFKKGTDNKAVTASLMEISRLKGVFNVEALFRNECDSELRLLYVARLDGTTDTTETTRSIQSVDNVEYAEAPPERSLFSPAQKKK